MNGRFRLDKRGQLAAEDAEGQEALPKREGTYALMPTAPDLMVFVRSPPGGGKAAAPRVVLAGDAEAFPLADLVAFLSQSRWSGVVSVHEPAAHRSLVMKDGEVRGASSDLPADRLGEVMVRLGYLEQKQVDDMMKSHPPSRLGRALVESGAIQSHDLWKCINDQVSEIFHSMVLCREGAFLLVDQPLDDKAQNIQLSTQSLLMDSIRKIDEMAHFRKRVAHSRLYVAKKRASDGTLEADEDKVLGLANGERNVLQLGQAAKLSEFDVTKVIFRLMEGGFASVSERPSAGSAPAPVQTPVATGAAPSAPGNPGSEPARVIQTFNAIFRDIAREVSRRGMQRDLLASANAALAGKGLSASPVLTGLTFDPEGNLPEGKLLEQFTRSRSQLGSEPVATLRQVLSDVMFFMLFQAGELLETSADEELATRVKSLLAALDG